MEGVDRELVGPHLCGPLQLTADLRRKGEPRSVSGHCGARYKYALAQCFCRGFREFDDWRRIV